MHEQPQNTLLLTTLTPDERTRAWQRYQILRHVVEHHMPLAQVARDYGLSLRTLYRWLAQYRRAGLGRLARRGRSDRGHQRGFPPELKQVIEGLALRKPPPTVALIYRQVSDLAQRNGWPVPNYTVRGMR